MSEELNRRVVLTARPGYNGEPQVQHFKTEICPFPKDILDGQVIIKSLVLSVDPAMRCQMNEDTGVTYLQPWKLNECVEGFGGVGVVIKSKSQKFVQDDIVTMSVNWPWSGYFVASENALEKVDQSVVGDHISLILSCLGLIGLTSLLGIREKGFKEPNKEQTLVISGAAGACGHLAGQIGKLDGYGRVVGICGTDEKCKLLTEDLGFDASINYKSKSFEDKLKESCIHGIDVYFDNVGGDISEIVIKQMNQNSKVILCGQISQYNKDVPYPPPVSEEMQKIIKERNIFRERYLVLNYAEKFAEGLQCLTGWLKTNKLKVIETFEDGLENTPKAFINMMTGKNFGKQLVRVAQ